MVMAVERWLVPSVQRTSGTVSARLRQGVDPSGRDVARSSAGDDQNASPMPQLARSDPQAAR